jgi:hypothetical protein
MQSEYDERSTFDLLSWPHCTACSPSSGSPAGECVWTRVCRRGSEAAQVNEQAVLYALSTLAQTCAALAALVGALGIYAIQVLKDRHAVVERQIRSLLAGHPVPLDWASAITTDEAVRRARELVAHPEGQAQVEVVPQMQQALVEWDQFDPDQRRSKRLLGLFVGWNLFVIALSLVGFMFVPRLACRWWASASLWVVAIGTAVATGAMLAEAHGSLARRLRKWRLGNRLLSWLEEGHHDAG